MAGLAILAGVLTLALALPVAVGAQQAVTLASLQISLWPEFDKPSTLVILDGQLAPGVSLPANLSLRMPAAAQAPNAVAVLGSDGTTLLTVNYTTAQVGGDIIIKFAASSNTFRVEYYDPALVTSGEARSYAFKWQSDYAIGAVAVRVQQPSGARNLIGQPALTSAGAGEFGLTYYTASLGTLAPGGIASLNLGYSKTGSGLSVQVVGGTQPSPAATAIAPATSGVASQLPWILGGSALALALIGGAALYIRRERPIGAQVRFQHARRRAAPVAPLRRAEPVPLAQPEGLSEATSNSPAETTFDTVQARFCTQCGQRHQPSDRFCRKCGAPVRE